LGSPGADRKIQMTDLWAQVVAGIETIRPVAVGLDPLVEIFDGDEMVRVQARQFVAPMRNIARKRDLAVYLAGHPSKTSAQTKTGTAGTTGWSAAMRGRQFLEIVYDDDNNDTGRRKLHIKKVTGGKAGFSIDLSFNDVGVLVGESERPADGKSALEMALVKVSLAEHDFLSFVMKRNEQGRPLFLNKKGGDYAPDAFAASQGVSARDRRRTKDQHERTMEALLDQKRLISEPFGPPSKGKMRLVIPSRKEKQQD
jgi:RecA-family ATPase